jgi:hypothetical protein
MLKDTNIGEKTTIYLGRNAGNSLMSSFKRAKSSIRIVSPYISPEYIDLLIDKFSNGVDVSLLVSSDIEAHREINTIYQKIIRQTQHIDNASKAIRIKGLIASCIFAVLSAFIIAGPTILQSLKYYKTLIY